MFGPKRDDATGDYRRQHGEKRHDLCSSPNIISVIKQRNTRCLGHVAWQVWGEERCIQDFVGKHQGKTCAKMRG